MIFDKDKIHVDPSLKYGLDGVQDLLEQPPQNFCQEHKRIFFLLVATLLFMTLVIMFAFRTYAVDGPSMESTLHNNDRMIINKLPRTMAKVRGKKYIPSRYDIIVFKHEGTFGSDIVIKKDIIKRVIALPGERITIKDNVVKVYNSEHPDGFLPDSEGPQGSVVGFTAGELEMTVPDGEIFAMGDNRPNSLDSRVFGTFKSDDIVGKLSVRIFPLNKLKIY